MRRLFTPAIVIMLLTAFMTDICYSETNAPVTRAEFASVLMGAIDGKAAPPRNEEVKTPAAFFDVPEGGAYYDAIMHAADKGYISGFPDGSFKPDAPITFEQMVTITSAMLRISADTDAADILSGYSDHDKVSPYAGAYIAENIKRGYINIENNEINPKRTVDKPEAEAYISMTLSENIAYGLNIPDETSQLIIVTADGYDRNAGRTHLYSKDQNGVWQNIKNFNCFIGEAGFSDDKLLEGRSNTPVGLFTIGTAFGAGDNPGTNMPYRQIQPDDVWVDDPQSELYNTWQKRGGNNGQWGSAENMNISAYRIGFVINYNTEEMVPYAGSAFFFHVYNMPTQGCVGASRVNVTDTVKWLNPEYNPLILMCPIEKLKDF